MPLYYQQQYTKPTRSKGCLGSGLTTSLTRPNSKVGSVELASDAAVLHSPEGLYECAVKCSSNVTEGQTQVKEHENKW